MELKDLSIGKIREKQKECEEKCKTIGEWKSFWRDWADEVGLSHQDALKVAQDRI